MKLFFKIKNLNTIRKSNKIKKISKKIFNERKTIFKKMIENKFFEERWFLNNFEVFNYFLLFFYYFMCTKSQLSFFFLFSYI